MNDLTGPVEPMVVIPIWMNCKDNELRVMDIDSRHERGCSNRYPDPDMPHKDCDCHD